MKIIRTKNFDKSFKKLSKKIQIQVKHRFTLFMSNRFDVQLNDHKLHGSLNQYRSFSINGDVRLIYEEVDTDVILLIDIGTHSYLYE